MTSKTSIKILVVDDDDHISELLTIYFEDQGWQVTRANRASRAIASLKQSRFDTILVDFQLPDGDGLQIIDHIRQRDAKVPIIFMTGHGSIDTAVAAMRAGAFEYLSKPLNMDEVLIKVRNALELTNLRRNLDIAQDELARRNYSQGIIGHSDAMRSVMRSVRIVAGSEVDQIIVTGESGVGKNLVANAIHQASPRQTGPFIEITCTALPDTLLESELFGHERGAFTDARTKKTGLFEAADRGTAFLDEIGDMSLSLQAKLLGFLESRRVRRVGSNREKKVDVRVIAASNRDLFEQVKERSFREDLLYRLNVIEINIPPLRERRQDIPLLAMHFLKIFAEKQQKSVYSYSNDAIEKLMSFSWPGNVRQLRNAIERAVVFSTGEQISADELPQEQESPRFVQAAVKVVPPNKEETFNLASLERECVLRALDHTKGNQSAAAKLLGITRNQIVYKLKKLRMEKSQTEPSIDTFKVRSDH